MRIIAELTVLAGRPRVISILESGEAALRSALAELHETCRVTVVPAASSEHGLRVARRMLRRRCARQSAPPRR